MLIKEELNSQLNSIIGKCFEINRLLDRGMSLLDVKWKMIKSAAILHPMLAHTIIGDEFADAISTYQGHRGCLSEYPTTPFGNKDYKHPVELFKDYFDRLVELQDMSCDAIDLCDDFGDYTTKKFLMDLLERLSKYTKIALNLVDILEQYGTDSYKLQIFDSVIDKYI